MRPMRTQLTEGKAQRREGGAPIHVSQPAIARHCNVLEQADLISRQRRATFRRSHLEAEPLGEATAWLPRYRSSGTRATIALTNY
jgi:hypothetical protein